MADQFAINSASRQNAQFHDVGNGAFAERVAAGMTAVAAATFNRPNDAIAYAIGDLVANNTVAGTVVPMQFAIGAAGRTLKMLRVRARKSGATIANAAFRLHLFDALPAVTNGDNGVFAPDHSANWLGAFDITSMLALSDGAVGSGVPLVGSSIAAVLPSDVVYGVLEARGTYAPTANETFAFTIEAAQD